MRKTTDPLPHKSQTGAWQFPGAAAFPLTTDLDFTRPFAIERRSVFCRSDPVVGKEQKFSRIASDIHRVPIRLVMRACATCQSERRPTLARSLDGDGWVDHRGHLFLYKDASTHEPSA